MQSMATAEVQQFIEKDTGLARLQEVVVARLDAQGFDAGHDLVHALRVASWTLRLDPKVDRREAIAAALLHDVVNLPKDHPERSTASTQSADVARSILPDCGFDEEGTERIAHAIESHSFSRGLPPANALARALQDADRLETLGSIGLMRVFSTGARMGAAYFDAADPWAEGRPFDDLRFSIDHFAVKLLSLPDSMQTEKGREEGRRRVERMRRFLRDLADEIGHTPPRWL